MMLPKEMYPSSFMMSSASTGHGPIELAMLTPQNCRLLHVCLPCMLKHTHGIVRCVNVCTVYMRVHVSIFIDHQYTYIRRCYGVGTGKMVQQQALEKIWRCCLVICQDGGLLRRICWPIVCMHYNSDNNCNNIYVCVFYDTGREEYLTEAVIFWNRRKIRKLPNLLVKRLAKARN